MLVLPFDLSLAHFIIIVIADLDASIPLANFNNFSHVRLKNLYICSNNNWTPVLQTAQR